MQLRNGRKIFRSHSVKPYVKPLPEELVNQFSSTNNTQSETEVNSIHTGDEQDIGTEETKSNATDVDLGDKPRKVTVRKGSIEERAFAESRKSELDGLLNDGTFLKVHESEVEPGVRIFG